MIRGVRVWGPLATLGKVVPVGAALAVVPVAEAHGAAAGPFLSRELGVILVTLGAVILVGAALLKRGGRLDPTDAIHAVLAGIALAAVGAIIFEGMSPDPAFTAESMPFPRSWYPPLALGIGLAVAVGSFVVGWWRWPDRPRYTFLGLALGLWISYPYLLGPGADTHPLGYALVVGTPVLVGYVLWQDAAGTLRTVLRDRVARRFGLGVGLLVGLFFLAASGFLSFFWEEGVPHETAVVVLPVRYQLVVWPTLEVAVPHVPVFLALSIGIVAVVGTLSALIGLNAAIVARQWRAEEAAGLTQGTAGTAAVIGTCTCGCCGPLVAKVAILAAGPSIAAPLYWVFVDGASPLGTMFVVGSFALFTASLLYAVRSAGGWAPTPA